jgi:hypothetical protein
MNAAFDPTEARRLMTLPQIGPQVIRRLEDAGYRSLADIRRAGLDEVVAAVCGQVGNRAWANRRRALERAIGG